MAKAIIGYDLKNWINLLNDHELSKPIFVRHDPLVPIQPVVRFGIFLIEPLPNTRCPILTTEPK